VLSWEAGEVVAAVEMPQAKADQVCTVALGWNCDETENQANERCEQV